jgi:gamma-glutamyl hercynylcysteine S-oxide synthase
MLQRLDNTSGSADETELYLLVIYHEDMHDEAFIYARQSLAYPAPELSQDVAAVTEAGPLPGDAAVPEGVVSLGSPPEAPFVFDNEKWTHAVPLEPFRIARAPVTNAEFLTFLLDGGYRRREFWSDAGWRWRQRPARTDHSVGCNGTVAGPNGASIAFAHCHRIIR